MHSSSVQNARWGKIKSLNVWSTIIWSKTGTEYRSSKWSMLWGALQLLPQKCFIFDSKLANIYVDKGGSNIARKFLFWFMFKLFSCRIFEVFVVYLNIQSAIVFEKFSEAWKHCLWVQITNPQRILTIQSFDPRSEKSFVETRF